MGDMVDWSTSLKICTVPTTVSDIKDRTVFHIPYLFINGLRWCTSYSLEFQSFMIVYSIGWNSPVIINTSKK